MRRLTIVLTFVLCTIFSLRLSAEEKLPQYEIASEGTGTQGTYLVKVTVIGKKNVKQSTLARCAVHGVLFRGFSNKEKRQNQKPLAGSAAVEAQHADYFKSFFAEEGPAAGYVSNVDGSRQVTKVGKEYRVSSVVSVNKEQLRKDLKEAGVIKGLDSAF